jgi:hypothetical protein
MGRDKAAAGGPKGDEPLDPDTASRSSRLERRRAERRKRDKKRKRWLGGVGTGVLIVVLSWGLTVEFPATVGRWLSSSSERTPSPPAKKPSLPKTSSPVGGSPAGQNPARICAPQMVSENSLYSWEVSAWTFPRRLTPTASEIADVDGTSNNADLTNQYLYNDGGYAPFTDTQLILQDNCPEPVIVTDVQVEKSCQAPLDGSIFVGQNELSTPSSTSESATTEPGPSSAQLGFDLDSSNPEAMLASGWNFFQWTQEYDTGSLATIPANGDYTFDIRAIATKMACQFSIEITYLSHGKNNTEPITDGGQPFRVSALLTGPLDAKKPAEHPYAGYEMLYVGWHASPWPDGSWVREDPQTWKLCSEGLLSWQE